MSPDSAPEPAAPHADRDEAFLVPGAKVLHRFNRDLGPGEVVARVGGRVRVRFPRTGSTLEFAVRGHAFTPLRLPAGVNDERWHEAYHEDLVERLANLEVDDLRAWENRVASLRLTRLREADGLGSFLGGRIEIFPHQLHVAEQATASDPVRWLLADEVGLGKTVEACLILSRLLRTRRAERVMIAAPASLTVQWLGELYRKFHQVFVLLDGERVRDVRRDFGPGFNPFEIHPLSVVAIEDLVEDTQLAREAREARPDLLVVDEAHRLEKRPGHPGSPAYRTIAPLAADSRHVLLLSATPLEADAYGFFRLLQILRPDQYPSWERFHEGLEKGELLAPCTSGTTRDDIGGLPPRVGDRVPLPVWPEFAEAVAGALALPHGNALERKRRLEAAERAFRLPTGESDPRILWILEREREWRRRGDKMLIFVHDKAALDLVRGAIERATLRKVGIFHEELSPAARDLEVAQFALPDGPTILLSTEAGGEGRNFEFCRGLVLFDLPWEPALVEQRIGRLDRINRRRPVEITYFAPAHPFAAALVDLYERLGIFREPLGGLDRSLAHVEEAIRRAFDADPPDFAVDPVIEETREARARMRRGFYHHLHRNGYRPDRAEGILDRIPGDLEPRTAEVVLEACRQFGFEVVEKPGANTWYIEFGNESILEHLPGSKGGERWLGTFDRREAVRRETLDFFASGHPLVEGILMELEDGHRGEVTFLDVPGAGVEGAGILALVKEGAEFRTVAIDFEGNRRPEWTAWFREDPPPWRAARPADWGLTTRPDIREGFGAAVRRILYPLQSEGKLVGAAAFRLLP